MRRDNVALRSFLLKTQGRFRPEVIKLKHFLGKCLLLKDIKVAFSLEVDIKSIFSYPQGTCRLPSRSAVKLRHSSFRYQEYAENLRITPTPE